MLCLWTLHNRITREVLSYRTAWIRLACQQDCGVRSVFLSYSSFTFKCYFKNPNLPFILYNVYESHPFTTASFQLPLVFHTLLSSQNSRFRKLCRRGGGMMRRKLWMLTPSNSQWSCSPASDLYKIKPVKLAAHVMEGPLVSTRGWRATGWGRESYSI